MLGSFCEPGIYWTTFFSPSAWHGKSSAKNEEVNHPGPSERLLPGCATKLIAHSSGSALWILLPTPRGNEQGLELM